jgi:hypothetical protein
MVVKNTSSYDEIARINNEKKAFHNSKVGHQISLMKTVTAPTITSYYKMKQADKILNDDLWADYE